MAFHLPPSKQAVLDAISDRAYRELAERYDEERHALEAVGLGRSGPAQSALLKERDEHLTRSMIEQAHVIAQAALAPWRFWVVGAVLVLALLLFGAGAVVYAHAEDAAERALAVKLWIAVAIALGAGLGMAKAGELLKG